MDELFQDNRLGQLEEKIDGLIQTYRGIRDDRDQLSLRVEALESENRDLKTRVSDMVNQNELIMQKVKSILDKVEQIEV